MISARYPVTALFLLFLFDAEAQVSLGLRSGLAFSDVVFKQVEGPALPGLDISTRSRTGLTGALMVDIPLSGHLSLMPELGYLQRGFKQKTAFPVRPGTLNTVLDYFQGALPCRFHLGHGRVRLHFLAGITYGYLFGVRQYFLPTQGERSEAVSSGPDDLDMNRWNFGLCGGAGPTFRAGPSLIFMGVRYDHGLSGLWNDLQVTDIDGNMSGKLNSYDRTFQFTIGWVFPLGERKRATGTKKVRSIG